MARPRSVDRDRLLDVAERIAAASSAASLSFGTLATEASVPKASVQSVFGTKEALIEAMVDRWLTREQARFARAAGPNPDPQQRVQAHIQTIAEEPADDSRRGAALMAALVASGERSESTARWYAARIGDLSADDEHAKRLRLAFLAAEGAYFMRHLAGIEIDDRLWREIFADLLAFTESVDQKL